MKYKIVGLLTFALVMAATKQVGAQAFVRPCKSAPPTTMQAFTASSCSTMAIGETILLSDTRNGMAYRVRKFADNHCWMIDNMKLAGVTLTSANSDVTSNVTLPAAVTSLTSNNTSLQIIDGSTQAYCATASNFAADSTTRCGYHYNWMAATAGTGTADLVSVNATTSICPKGWKLPPNSGDGSFANLYSQGLSSTFANLTNDTTGFSARFSGRYLSGWNVIGSSGGHWSRSANSSASNAYSLYFGAGIVYPQGSNGKYGGYSVRCVL